MGWLTPGFLLGALAVGIPVWLHMLKRNASVEKQFSSLMLFEPQQRSTTRRRRIDHWLLLLLRIAVLLLLAAAFAEPYVRGHLPGAAPDKLLVLALDNSYSMRAGTRMADARREALGVISAKARDTRAQVVALGARADALTEQVQDAAVLNSAIQGVQASDARGSLALLTNLSRTLAAGTRMPIELHLFSDMQATGLPPDFNELRLPPGVTLILHQVGEPVTSNWTVGKCRGARASLGSIQDTHCRNRGRFCHPGSHSDGDTADQRSTRRASNREGARFGARLGGFLPVRTFPTDWARASVQIDSADALVADDSYNFVIQRSERAHGLFVHQGADSTTGLYFRSALGSAADAAVVLDEVTVDQLRGRELSAYAFVVLSDVAGLQPAVESRVAAMG